MSILFVLFSNHLLGQNEVRLKKAKKKKKYRALHFVSSRDGLLESSTL